MERREFIKNACVSCGLAAVVSILPAAILQSCTTLPMLKTSSENKDLVISKTKLAPDKKLFVLRNNDIQYDVLLVKNPDDTYYALYMQCTHNDNPLTANDKGLYCSLHGSVFDLQGKITNGPATQPLKHLSVTENNGNIIIHNII
jgi:nitrite reductase/ring-hydroxylating ferredoxin subunit